MTREAERHPGEGTDKQRPAANAFSKIARHYDILMRDVPYARWKRYVLDLVALNGGSSSLRPGAKVLDLACGTGTFALMLARHGYRVVGVDVSEPMIREARRKAAANHLDVELMVQDAAALDLPASSFVLCTSLFDSLNYIVDPAKLESAFERVCRCLVPDGFFVFDLNTPMALRMRMFDQEDLDPCQPIRYRWRSHFDEATRLCVVRMQFWVGWGAEEAYFEEVHIQRAHDAEEVHSLLREAGFGAIRVYHAYSLAAATPASDRVFYLARRTTR